MRKLFLSLVAVAAIAIGLFPGSIAPVEAADNPIYPGWNHIVSDVPGANIVESVRTYESRNTCVSAVWYWDGAEQAWYVWFEGGPYNMNTLSHMTEGEAYWVYCG